MVSFRRSILALAVLALFVGLATAQVGTPTGTPPSTGGVFACSAAVSVPPQLRSEGVTELIGDIVLSCTGGPTPAAGSLVQTANITVSLPVTVTSRILGTAGVSNASEALLLIDEPGSTSAGAGPALPQTICATPGNGAGVSGCTAANGAVGSNPGLYFDPSTGQARPCSTTVGAGPCSTFAGVPPNVFQGLVSSNQVTFLGIPVLAPMTSGISRVFRITNVRANTSAVGTLGPAGTTPLNASVSISGSASLPINNPVQVAGFVQSGLAPSVVVNKSSVGFTSITQLQCNTLNSSLPALPSELLRYSENFATAFKTRVAPTASTNGLFSGPFGVPPSVQQNIPGVIYNSESGFIQPSVTGTSGQTAGLADFGTRLRAVFANIPSNVNVYVSVSNLIGGATFGGNGGPGNLALPPNQANTAFLVQSETAPDFNGQAPILNPTTTISGGIAVYQVPISSTGAGEAVWEVVASNPNILETLDFGIWFQFTGGKPSLGTGTVDQSFAPVGGSNIPRFVDPTVTPTNIITVTSCTTNLLFPFVTNEAGFETGMSIANTTTDPFGTTAQNGSCYIQFYGDNVPASNTTVTAPCTAAGACTGAINSGKVFANTLTGIIGSSFQGYAIAVCNFQLAHGFAFISDTHATNLAMGYLALVIGQPGLRSTVTTTAETLEN
jgi:hypothetical protein